MREYHGEKRYKDYLLKRYSISRGGHLLKDTHGGGLPDSTEERREGLLFRRWCDRFKD